MTGTTSSVPVVTMPVATGVVATSSEFRVVSRNVNFFEGESTFASEGQNVGYDRRVRVPMGQLYVFPDGVIDNLGHNEVYFGGEILYVSKDKQDKNRKIFKLNQYGAQYVISGQRTLPGISVSNTDVATAQMKLTIEIHNPRSLLNLYPTRKNTELQNLIDGVISNNVNDGVWSVNPGTYLEQIVNAINPFLDGNGIRIVVSNIALTRTMPRQVDEIIKECRLAEHRLVDKMDGGRFQKRYDDTLNKARIDVLKNDATVTQLEAGESASNGLMDEGDITTFVNNVILTGMPQGIAFFELVKHKIKAAGVNSTKLDKFVGYYAGPQLRRFVNQMLASPTATDLDFSLSVLQYSFT